jgi:FHS family glucose/mannose:H+ symporter-like MFS transporter
MRMNLFPLMMVMTLVVSGMGVALLGSIKVPLAKRLAIDEARVGGLVSIFGFMLIPVILGAGFLTDLVGRQVVLMGGSLIFAISLLLLAWAKNFGSTLVAVLFMSTGWSLLINVGNVLVPRAFPGSEAFSTNLANVFFGLGAFLTPVGTAFYLKSVSLKSFLGGLAILSLVPGVLAAILDPSLLTSSEGGENTLPMSSLLNDPVLWLLGFCLFFYGPLEASLGAWTTTFLGERGLKEGTAASMLSAFWLVFMAARLITAFALTPGYELPFLLGLALGAAVFLSIGVLGKNQFAAVGMVIGAGLALGPIFPTVMAVLLKYVPSSLHGRAVGMFFAIGGIGWTLIPIFIGSYAKRTNLTRAFGIAVLTALGLAGVVLGLWWVMTSGG